MKFIVRYDGADIPVEVLPADGGYEVTIGERRHFVDFVGAGPFVHSLRFEDGAQFGLTHHSERTRHEVTLLASKAVMEVVDPLSLIRKSDDEAAGQRGVIKALMPGRIVRVLVEKGAEVRKGTPLLVLEAMKMENELQAPADGTVEEIFVVSGAAVERGTPLVQLG